MHRGQVLQREVKGIHNMRNICGVSAESWCQEFEYCFVSDFKQMRHNGLNFIRALIVKTTIT